MEILANLVFISNASEYLTVIHDISAVQSNIHIVEDDSNDDILWWSLAWARAFEVCAMYWWRSSIVIVMIEANISNKLTFTSSSLSSPTFLSSNQLTGVVDYLERAELCFVHVSRDWTEDTCGGGEPCILIASDAILLCS